MNTVKHLAQQLTAATEQNLISSWNIRLVTDTTIRYYTKPEQLTAADAEPVQFDLSIYFHKTTPSKTIQALVNLLHDKYGCTLITMPTDDTLKMRLPRS
jgi:hypothetical protein